MRISQSLDDGLKTTGAPSLAELHESACYRLPGANVSHPVAVIECVEGIPCNPCETSCPQHAITVGSEITGIPVVDSDACTGCGICVAACPGLAIYLKHMVHSDGLSMIAFPFEYLPLPAVGDTVDMVDRFGTPVCKGTILKVVSLKRYDRTAVVHASYPTQWYEQVVGMKGLDRVLPA